MPPIRPLLVALLLLFTSGCPTLGGRGPGDDDDAGADDDDSAVDDDDATGDDDDGAPDGQAGELPCEEEIVDVWTLEVPGGAELRARVDTVSAETAFDPAMSLFDGVDVDVATYLTGGDDEIPCTFPPPGGYACPEITWLAEATTGVAITVSNLGCANKDGGAYVLAVGVDGEPTAATLVADDYLLGGAR